MGISTFLICLLPSFSEIGIAASIIFICLRKLQGLALGGEYSGAATCVGKHAPCQTQSVDRVDTNARDAQPAAFDMRLLGNNFSICINKLDVLMIYDYKMQRRGRLRI
jgi:MFS family permease